MNVKNKLKFTLMIIKTNLTWLYYNGQFEKERRVINKVYVLCLDIKLYVTHKMHGLWNYLHYKYFMVIL